MTYPLFWTEKFADLNQDRQLATLTDITGKSHRIQYAMIGDCLRIPYRATFGGWVDENGSPTQPSLATEATQVLLRLTNPRSFQLSLPPSYLWSGLGQKQFEPLIPKANQIVSDLNHHIELRGDSGLSNFSRGNRKRVRAFYEKGGEVQRAGFEEARDIFELLSLNRVRRGVKLSMDWQTFSQSVKQLPDDFEMFKATLGGGIVAAAMVVRIIPSVRYVLFWGDNASGRALSAVAPLAEYLVNLCAEEGIVALDLGISSVEGVVDDGLARFKTNLGASHSPKITAFFDRLAIETITDSARGEHFVS